MSDHIRVKVTVDTDELRHWAERHADAGHHGVAHVLYKAANEGESLTEQAIHEARVDERERIAQAIEAGVLPSHPNEGYKDGFRRAADIARHTPEATP